MRLALLLLLAACAPSPSSVPDPTPSPQPAPPEEPVLPGLRSDIVVQQPPPPVDVLFVVDNSSSMMDEQAYLQDSFPDFFDAIIDSGLDYHIGVVSTDIERPTDSGQLRAAGAVRFIDPQTPDPFDVFTEMIDGLGVLAGSAESGRAAAYLALETVRDTPTNIDFLRPDASLHIVFISDTFDNSGNTPISQASFIAWADNLKSQPDLVGMHAIVNLGTSDTCGYGPRAGIQYIEYANAFNGNTNSICDSSWIPLYSGVAQKASALRTQFLLDELPELDTLQVVVQSATGPAREFSVCLPEPDDRPCEVVYDSSRNSIRFVDFVPALGSELTLRYQPVE